MHRNQKLGVCASVQLVYRSTDWMVTLTEINVEHRTVLISLLLL